MTLRLVRRGRRSIALGKFLLKDHHCSIEPRRGYLAVLGKIGAAV